MGIKGGESGVQISIVVPCYNEELVVCELLRRLRGVVNDIGITYEIVCVDDGSSDGTLDLLKNHVSMSDDLVVLELSRNFGHQFALTAGLEACVGEMVLIIDADLQDPPELLPEMMGLMSLGADVVYGQRRQRKGESFFKKLTASIFYRLLDKLTDIDIPLDAGDFRLITRDVCSQLLGMKEQNRFIRGMVSWVGFNQTPILYDRDERFAGETKYPFRKMVKFAVDAITGFSSSPLKVAGYTSLFFFILAFGFILYAIIGKLYFEVEQGWASLIGVVSLLGAAQLLVLGVLGEYIGRLYIESKSRPLYIVKNIFK